jgi:hypothetical protein
MIIFSNKNGTPKYKFLAIEKQNTYFVRHYSDSPYKYSETDIKGMFGFLVDNIFVDFGDQVFQQSVGILMSTNSLVCSYSDIYTKQNLFRSCYGIKTKQNTRVLQQYM